MYIFKLAYGSILLFVALLSAIETDQAHIDDIYYRELYCNPEEELKPLPSHFLDCCKKANIDPKTIHVYKTHDGQYMGTVGKNIMLREDWFNKKEYQTEEEQKWGFSHELSHAKHNDHVTFWRYQQQLAHFQIASSMTATAWIIQKLYYKKLTTPAILRTGGLWTLGNIAALYIYYQFVQQSERRANEEAAWQISAEAGISVLKKIQWEWETTTTLKNRLNLYIRKLGFCDHGPETLQIARLEKIKKEQDALKVKETT